MKRFYVAIAMSILISLPMNANESNLTPAVYKQPNADYSAISKDPLISKALDVMATTTGNYARSAIMGSNLSGKPIKVMFKNLSGFGPNYANDDALGMKNGSQLVIYINEKHRNAPPEALAALLSHEAMHQDTSNSINEETYAWTYEAQVWTELKTRQPMLGSYNNIPLVRRENQIYEMFKNAKYTSRIIRQSVQSNPGYRDLPPASPGFENVQ